MSNKVVLHNPLLTDIKVEYDKYGDNPKVFVIPAGELLEVEEPYASHVKKNIYNAIINDRNLNGIALEANPEAKKKLMSEIVMDI